MFGDFLDVTKVNGVIMLLETQKEAQNTCLTPVSLPNAVGQVPIASVHRRGRR